MTAQEEAGWLAGTVGVRALEDRAVIAVRGDDARSWLNGQLTQDLRPLSPERNVYGLVLSAKGRILADATVHDRAGEVFVDVPASAWPVLSPHLEKYIIMEDVTLSLEPSLVVVTAQGPSAASVLEGPESARLRTVGRDRLVEKSTLPSFLAELTERARAAGGGLVSDAGWELARVRAGVPRFGRDFDEHVYPQEAGLEKTAVSFQKGCYLGQEVVCMLESRGQVSRRLVRLESAGALSPGTPLVAPSGEVGHVSSVVAEGDAVRALGFVKRAALGEPTLTGGAATVRLLGPA